MTYQEEVAEYVKYAPEELREYVIGKLREGDGWKGDKENLITYCCFSWGKSEEGTDFWAAISLKNWHEAINTEFWKNRINKQTNTMTDYQKAVQDHMATAPQELREYVCERLKDQHEYMYRKWPMRHLNFSWEDSEEDYEFWNSVDDKRWQNAIASDFWLSRTQQPKPEEPSNEDAVCTTSVDQSEKYKTMKPHFTHPKPESMTDYQNKIREQYVRLLDKQLAKNKDYGNSVFNDIEVFGETISAETSCKARIADKLKRLSSASFQVDESHDDTIDDLIGYLVAYRIIRNNKRHTKIEL